MATVFDTAKYITEQSGEISAMKLQKLMFYAQAWNIVWEERELFPDEFEAWANGPVLPSLYQAHKGMFSVNAGLFPMGNSGRLNHTERTNIDKVLGFYGEQTAQWLSNLTHQEQPWLEARGNLPPGANSTTVIPKASMHEYYSGL